MYLITNFKVGNIFKKFELTYCNILGSCPPSLSLPQPATMPISPVIKTNVIFTAVIDPSL